MSLGEYIVCVVGTLFAFLVLIGVAADVEHYFWKKRRDL